MDHGHGARGQGNLASVFLVTQVLQCVEHPVSVALRLIQPAPQFSE
jgi:hypothetical protein